ncbi:MAG: EamA family transporter [Methanotrichaceae archaeon]
MFAVTLVLICVLVGASGQIIWKQGMSHMDKINNFHDLFNLKTILNIFTNKYIILGIMLYASGFILWMAALSTLELSFMYPLLSLAYVVTAVFAVVFLGEVVTVSRWAGIVLVLAGCILIMRS